MYQHLLLATDGSELAETAVAHGLNLAKALKAKVTIVPGDAVLPPTSETSPRRMSRTNGPRKAFFSPHANSKARGSDWL
jgi:nucleotide-binding universal stress UspA family protein